MAVDKELGGLTLSCSVMSSPILTKSLPLGESLFLRKLLWASLPNKQQKLRDR
jgi:hypothetical protein